MEEKITPIENLRQRMVVSAFSQAANLLADKENTNTWIAEQIHVLVDTFLSRYEVNSIVPVHLPHPLGEHVLTKIARNGNITRTIKVVAEDFYPWNDEERERVINNAIVAPGAGRLTNIEWKQVGFSDNGKVVYLEVTGDYTPTNSPTPHPRGRRSKATV